MKKSILCGVIGAGALVTSSFGQGVLSGNYGGSGPIGSAITYSTDPLSVPAGKAGLAVGGSFSGELFYFNGSSYVAIPSSIQPFFATDGNTASGAGYSSVTSVQIPNWTSGSVSLEWYVFNTVAVGSYAPGTISGYSAPFTMVPADSQAPSYPDFSSAVGYSAFTVAAPVPEPATLALAGLGGFGMLMAFRRKKA